uniref:Uncharacterized protein n=1 Tax=Glossina palpalis gambiensis TaxID=67801 RepID=A0A1B0AZF4_9MUSC
MACLPYTCKRRSPALPLLGNACRSDLHMLQKNHRHRAEKEENENKKYVAFSRPVKTKERKGNHPKAQLIARELLIPFNDIINFWHVRISFSCSSIQLLTTCSHLFYIIDLTTLDLDKTGSSSSSSSGSSSSSTSSSSSITSCDSSCTNTY